MLKSIIVACVFLLITFFSFAQKKVTKKSTDLITNTTTKKTTAKRTLYGQASFYSSKFEGRKTATGSKFNHLKFTAACNSLPLGTWVRVTNLKNDKSIIVVTNDRLHKKTKRLIDLTMAGAKKLGFVNAGLARVKVEVLPNYKPSKK